MQAKRLLVTALTVLSACGGGSSGTGGSPAPAVTPLPASVEVVAPSTVELAVAMSFTTDVPAASSGLQFEWDFGDGAQSAQARPGHAYAAPGLYTVRVVVRNASGEQVTARANVWAGRFAALQGRRCSGADATGWCWQAPLPWGHRLNDVMFMDMANGWTVGDGGVMLRTRDGGLTWSERFMPGADSLKSIGFVDAQRGWVKGRDAQLLWLTSDGGTTWATAPGFPAGYPLPGNPRDAALPLPQLGSATGFIGDTFADWGSDADGSAWAVLTSYDSAANVTRASLATRSAAGATWMLATLPPAPSVQNYQVPTVRLSRAGGWAQYSGSNPFTATTWRTETGGTTWSQLIWPDGLAADQVVTKEFIDGNTLWIQAYRDGRPVYVTADGGRTWAANIGQPLGTQDRISSLVRDGGGGLLMSYDAYGQPERKYRSLDNGKNWLPLPGDRGLSDEISGLWFFDAQRGIATTRNGVVLDTDDAGRNWRRRAGVLPGSAGASNLQFLPTGQGWMVSGGWMLRSMDRGANWLVQATLPEMDGRILSVQWLDANHAKVTATSSCTFGKTTTCKLRLFTTDDGGAHWRSVGEELGDHFMAAFFSSLRGVSNSAQFTVDGGQTWQSATLASGDTPGGDVVRVTSGGVAWLLGREQIWRSTDMGQSWQVIAQGRYQTPVEFSYTGYLRDVHFADATNGWMVGDWGMVMNTRDGGQTWSVQRSALQNQLTKVFAFDASTVWIGGDANSILASATGGR